MNPNPFAIRLPARIGAAPLFLAGLVLVVHPPADAAAQAKPGGAPGRVAVGKCVTAPGTILRREAEGKPWQSVTAGETLYSGDLLLGLPGAALDSANGAVRLTFRSDLGGTSPLPIIETAVVLHDNKQADLDFTLDRGRVDLANQKKQGEARVRARIRGEAGEVVLTMPGAAVALEFISRWPAGSRFSKDRQKEEAPAMDLIVLALKGELVLGLEDHQVRMTAPPGPAFIHWESTTPGKDVSVQRLDALPAWAAEEANAELVKQRQAVLEQFRKSAQAKSVGAALDEFVSSDDPAKRRLALSGMGATDDLERLGNALANAKHSDVTDHGIRVLRHWMGRAPGQDMALYRLLMKNRNFSPVEAETVVQLLHTFGDDQLTRPELYETLIDYLEHEERAIRGLAHWHLRRLVPAGRDIDFNPSADPKTQAAAVARWRKLIPAGKLPPKAEPEKP